MSLLPAILVSLSTVLAGVFAGWLIWGYPGKMRLQAIQLELESLRTELLRTETDLEEASQASQENPDPSQSLLKHPENGNALSAI